MRPRYGPLYTRAVLRPFAEQLRELVPMSRVRTACDVLCDSGAATAVLAESSIDTVWCADTEVGLATVAAAGSRTQPRAIEDDRIPLAEQSCDLVVSLFTLGFAPALRAEMRRIARHDGTIVVLTWDSADPPAHEAALLAAVEGAASPPLADQLRAVLWSEPAAAASLQDVVRFDSVEQCWHAVVVERGVGDAGTQLDVTAARRRFDELLSSYEGADGTLRLPVRCRVFAGPPAALV